MFDYLAPADLLEGKSILITGASDGIGRACANCFANHGATVILLGRSQSKLEAVYDEIEKEQPGKVIIHPIDFATAQADDYKLLADSLGQQFGSLDGLLHNAALLGPRNPIEFYPDQDWQQLMQVNVNAAFYLTKALLPALSNSVDARLLFTSSSVGRVGRAYWGAYVVSKFAVEGLMQILADELVNTSSIRVNSLNPGGTRTAMRRSAYPAEDPQTQPTAESLMPVYLYLLSPAAQTIHGQALNARDFDPATLMSD
ncbi:MAG: YciK family oxidoreductase [Gammaproteobacteria bacterium]|jgi:NAD(P)-dependent dehydrogenase (short-subunit alcohol dehydrogenase family)|nr:YciK family oxidoreductase [Gammaproteobacteria bacterium]